MKQPTFLFRIVIFAMTMLFNISELKAQCPCPPKSSAPCTCTCSQDYTSCNILPSFESRVNETTNGYWRIITSNGIPNHTIGKFPLTSGSLSDNCCCGRPTALKEQNYTFALPAYSSEGTAWGSSKIFKLPTPPFTGKPETSFGVAVNGVPLDPAAAEWWDPIKHLWALNPLRHSEMSSDLDCNNGHVQRDGGYHYHGFPTGLYNKIRSEQQNAILPDGAVDEITKKRSNIVLLGWAFDGNPIYGEECGKSNANPDIKYPKSGYKLKSGSRGAGNPPDTYPRGYFVDDFEYNSSLSSPPPAGTLDECHGHTGPTPEFPDGIYHYHVLKKTDSTSDIGFPYIGRCYRLFTYTTGPNIFPK